ncbi:MAG: preprotein translocase subunit SecG [Phycisphaerales bacterium]|nr:preprotein translocase subunit SecG [Phycisphaerales bacterium]
MIDRSEPALLSDSFQVLGAMSPVATTLLVVVFLAVSITMILIVLVQRPQGGGLSGAFGAGGGGGGAGQTAFGTKTGDVLTWATIGIFVLFVVFAIILNFATRPGEPKDNTPSIVAPGTPRETVDDSEPVVDEGTDKVLEAVDDAADDAGDEAGGLLDAVDNAVESVEEVIDTPVTPVEPSDG